jgi:hypothetical protein
MRQDFEGAFGESFADVRLHTGPKADAGARAINATAFASGNDIGFAKGAFQPETNLGRGVLAHELGHVSEMRVGRDAPGTVRRFGEYTGGVGPGEWIRRLFGGGRFSNVELDGFVRAMNSPGYEWRQHDHDDTDNMARVIVGRMYPSESESGEAEEEAEESYVPPQAFALRVRLNMMRHLLSGHAAPSDKDAVLTILRNATDIELRQLVRQYPLDLLREQLGRRQYEQLASLLGIGVSYSSPEDAAAAEDAASSMPVQWKFNYGVRNSGQLAQEIEGLAIENFRIRPDGRRSAGMQVIAERAFLQGDNGISGEDIAVPGEGRPVSHPRDAGGEAKLDMWVVPQDRRLRPAWATRLRTSVPAVSADGPGASYGPIPAAENQVVEANLNVTLGHYDSGSQTETNEAAVTQGVAEGGELATGHTDIGRRSRRTLVGNETSLRQRDQLSLGASSRLGVSRRRARETMLNWHNSVTRTREELRELEMRGGFEHEDTSETEIELGGSIGAEAALELAAETGLELGVELGLDNPLVRRVLPSILSRVPGGAGRVLAGILQLVEGADAGLSFLLSPTGRLRVHGQGNARARQLWSEARRRRFEIGGRAANTDTTAVESGSGGAVTDTDEAGISAEAGLQQGLEHEVESGSVGRIEIEETSGSEVQISELYTASLEFQLQLQRRREIAETTQLFMPVVQDAELTFRVFRNEMAEEIPRVPTPTSGEQEQHEEEQ